MQVANWARNLGRASPNSMDTYKVNRVRDGNCNGCLTYLHLKRRASLYRTSKCLYPILVLQLKHFRLSDPHMKHSRRRLKKRGEIYSRIGVPWKYALSCIVGRDSTFPIDVVKQLVRLATVIRFRGRTLLGEESLQRSYESHTSFRCVVNFR